MSKNIVHSILDWVLYTSTFAALCAVGLSISTEYLLLDNVPDTITPLHGLIFCSTLFVYNVHYLIKKSAPEISDRFNWSLHNKHWHYVFVALGALGSAFCALQMPESVIIACIVLGGLSFSYSIPLLPFKDKKRLKDYGWLKIFVLTAVWTIVTSVLPVLYWGHSVADYPYEIAMRFVFMLTLCVAFDIRDMQTDKEAGIITLPNVLGLKGCYKLMTIAMLLFVVMSVVQYMRHPSLGRLVGELIVAGATKLVIDYSKKHPSDKAYLGLVDGMMFLYSLLVVLLAYSF